MKASLLFTNLVCFQHSQEVSLSLSRIGPENFEASEIIVGAVEHSVIYPN